MASLKKQAVGGPYLACAVFCDSVVRGEDGAMTAVRMIDRMTLTIPADTPSNVPSAEKAILANIEGLIGFKKGDSAVKHKVKLVMNSPSGKNQAVMEQPAEFGGEPNGGFNLRLRTTIAITETGLFWLDVYLDGKLMTRMPLSVSVERAVPAPVAKPVAKTRKKKS